MREFPEICGTFGPQTQAARSTGVRIGADRRTNPHRGAVAAKSGKQKIGNSFPSRAEYTVSDGVMVLTLEPAQEGGYVATSPFDPELITKAESLDEAFENATDAANALNESRKKLAKQLTDAEPSS